MKVYSIKTGLPLTNNELKIITKKDIINRLIDAEEALLSLGLPDAATQVSLALNLVVDPMTEEEFNQVI